MSNITHLFSKTYVVKRVALTTDSQGGWTQAYASQANVPGYMSRNNRMNVERIRFGQREALVSHVFFCDYNADIQPNDRLTHGGRTWNVLSTSEPGNLDHHLECLCEEVIDGVG